MIPGTGIGAGIGTTADATDDSGFEKIDHAVTAGLAVVGTVVGAVGGYFIGRKASKRIWSTRASNYCSFIFASSD